MLYNNNKKILITLSVGLIIIFTLVGGIYFYPKLFDEKTINDSAKVSEKKEQENDQSNPEEKALSIVKNLLEVKEWLNLFSGPGGTSPKTGGRPIIEIDRYQG